MKYPPDDQDHPFQLFVMGLMAAGVVVALVAFGYALWESEFKGPTPTTLTPLEVP